ncbi:MOSC N-terminal beta barrel domain-containing protein [Streptomyces sp. NPDC007157]|uniref:MOSC N-terminal beta barrel domain-containing protein n=1 Tax=Streptomyces sp. NPDC007157 TaxID=3154681 RepID=UPI0033D4D455
MGIAELRSTPVHPVMALRGLSPRQAVTEPWRPAGDRRWALIDDGGKVVTQRVHPRLHAPAPAPTRAARPPPPSWRPGGGIRPTRPGRPR